MNGSTLTLGLVAGLAAAGALSQRGSRAVASDFDLCFPRSAALWRQLRRGDPKAKVVQVAGYKGPVLPGTDPRWLKLSPEHWSHYVVVSKGFVHDLTPRQFGHDVEGRTVPTQIYMRDWSSAYDVPDAAIERHERQANKAAKRGGKGSRAVIDESISDRYGHGECHAFTRALMERFPGAKIGVVALDDVFHDDEPIHSMVKVGDLFLDAYGWGTAEEKLDLFAFKKKPGSRLFVRRAREDEAASILKTKGISDARAAVTLVLDAVGQKGSRTKGSASRKNHVPAPVLAEAKRASARFRKMISTWDAEEDFELNWKEPEIERAFGDLVLGYGNFRLALASRDPRFVIKLSMRPSDNLDEASAWLEAGPRTKAMLVPVVAHDPEGHWLVMERVTPYPWDETESEGLRALRQSARKVGLLDVHPDNVSTDLRLLDYAEPVSLKGSPARRGSRATPTFDVRWKDVPASFIYGVRYPSYQSLKVSVIEDGEVVGHLYAEETHTDRCPGDLARLSGLVGRDLRALVVQKSNLSDHLRGQGLGLKLYEVALAEAATRGFALAPNHCWHGGPGSGMTSKEAQRVWDKLRSRYVHAGEVFWGAAGR